MNGKRWMLACALFLCIAGVSCQKAQAPIPPNLKLSFETIKTQNSIPEEYGELEGVVVDSPNVARMFFEKDTKALSWSQSIWKKGPFEIVS